MVFWWEKLLLIEGWKSAYPPVNKLLRFLNNRTVRTKSNGSESSRRIYGCSLAMFCKFSGKTPDELVTLAKREIEELLESFSYSKRENGCAAGTVNTILFDLKTFFFHNGFRYEKEIDIETIRHVVRGRKRKEYIPTPEEAWRMAECAESLRDRAMILLMRNSGLRNSTVRAIRYEDVREELENGADIILIRVYPEMKELVFSACKGDLGYITFASKEVVDVLRLYIAEIKNKFGVIDDKDPLFSSKYNQIPQKERVHSIVTERQLQIIVKKAAFRAGILEWKHVVPHSLRKTFYKILRKELRDGTMADFETKVYFMGHIVPGGLEAYYDANKDALYTVYSKILFNPYEEKLTKSIKALKVAKECLNSEEAGKAIDAFINEMQKSSKSDVMNLGNETSIEEEKSKPEDSNCTKGTELKRFTNKPNNGIISLKSHKANPEMGEKRAKHGKVKRTAFSVKNERGPLPGQSNLDFFFTHNF
jgi:integrase